MNLSAVATFPRPYAERAHAFRAAVGNTPAAMTRSGSVRLVDLKKRCLPSGRLIPQHFLEHEPARIQDGFSHLGLGEFGTAHVTDDDQFIFTRNPGGCDVQMVFARIGDLGMDRTSAFLVSGPPCLAQGISVFPVMLESGNARAVTTGGYSFQAEVNADLSVANLLRLNFTLESNVPAATSVLRQAACFGLTGKVTGFPVTYLLSEIDNVIIAHGQEATFQRNPAKTFAAAKATSKSWARSHSASRLHEGAANFAYRIGRNSKFRTYASCKFDKVKVGGPMTGFSGLPSLFSLPLNLTAIVPNKVASSRAGVKPLGNRPVFHSVFEG